MSCLQCLIYIISNLLAPELKDPLALIGILPSQSRATSTHPIFSKFISLKSKLIYFFQSWILSKTCYAFFATLSTVFHSNTILQNDHSLPSRVLSVVTNSSALSKYVLLSVVNRINILTCEYS